MKDCAYICLDCNYRQPGFTNSIMATCPKCSSKFIDRIDRVYLDITKLSKDEETLIRTFLSRLLEGKKVYGDLNIDSDPRNFQAESYEERIDALMYDTVELIRRRRLERLDDA